jgi:putative hydrolase of the HAD superfamily
MKHIQAISLDLDDTLWAIWPVIDRAEAVLHQHISETFPLIGQNHDAQDLRRLRNDVHQSRPDLAHDLTELRRVSFERLLNQYDYDPQASYDLVDRFLELRHDVTLYPDVVPALSALSKRFAVVAVSNGNADVSRLGIGSYFRGQISASTAGVKKPDRRIFHMACELLKTDPAHILHVGDHPLEDVIGAQQAGLRAAWVNRNGDDWTHDEKPHAEVHDLAQLVEMLDCVDR